MGHLTVMGCFTLPGRINMHFCKLQSQQKEMTLEYAYSSKFHIKWIDNVENKC